MQIVRFHKGSSAVIAQNVTRAQWTQFAMTLPPSIHVRCLVKRQNNSFTFQLRDTNNRIIETVHVWKP
jgi:hypothetical protein